jgi:CRISPR-associated protein Csm3
MKLEKIVKISGNILVKTGLHIGAGNDSIHIGGVDNAVVKDPVTKKPYIPGSSIKGKVRTLLEWATNRVSEDDGQPYSDKNGSSDPIVRIFGNGKAEENNSAGPTRASFSDCFLIDSQKLADIGYTEIKTEVKINRRTGTASGSGPRSTERVPAGAKFNFEITYKVFDKQDEENLELLLLGMRLLENDALGGSTSRGYGRICFEDVSIDGDKEKFENIKLSPDSFKKWEKQGAQSAVS